MTWAGAFSQVWPWVVFAAVPVGIVLLYFLKLRREPVEVPSTYLWTRTIEDLHVNRLLQRLRQSILLWLQLLVVLLAGLALLRPGLRTQADSMGRLVFLLDVSASMRAPAATEADASSDVEDATGRSRFDLAQERIRNRIDAMTDSETAMLVTFSDRAEVMQGFTSDRNRLRDALDRCRVTSRPTDVLAALQTTDGLANPRRPGEEGSPDASDESPAPAELLLYSDGGFQEVTELNLAHLRPTYYAMGDGEVKNLAVVSFSAERPLQDPDRIDVFATVLNAGTTDAASEVSLFVDGQLADASSVDLSPEDQVGLSFTIQADRAVSLRLTLDASDALALDNQAYAALTPSGLVSVLVVGPENRPLRLAMETEKIRRVATCEFLSPDVLSTAEFRQRMTEGGDDLIIFDRCKPEEMPPTNTFFIGEVPPENWSWESPAGQMTLIDFDRTHPLLRYLELYSLLIFSGRSVAGPDGSVDLIQADVGPVLVLSTRAGYQDLVLGFELVTKTAEGTTQANTNWYAERSWPVFLWNVLHYLAGAAQSSGAPSYLPGQTVSSRLESVYREVTLVREDGAGQEAKLGTLPVDGSGLVEIIQTDQIGSYRLEAGGSGPEADASEKRVVDRFVVNLFDSQESRLATRPTVEIGYATVEDSGGSSETRQEYWRWALLLVLLLLGLEWWVFTRRIA